MATTTPEISSDPSLPTHIFRFHGHGGSLFGIQIVNLFLNLITFGVYSFWGRVRVRKYLFSQTEFDGDRFAYHGTGGELLQGWLKAMLVFGVPFLMAVALQVIAGPDSLLFTVLQALIYALLAFFIPVAMVNTRRYRLSRISWRGIRFSFRGTVKEFIGIYVKGWLLTVATFGLYYPFWQNRRQAFIVSHSYLGNRQFQFHGEGNELFWHFVLHLALTLPTIGICWIWYGARVQRYYLSRTSFGDTRFHCTITGGGLLGLWLVNALLLLCTLGLAWSWVAVRNSRYYVERLFLTGALDAATVIQEAQPATAMGEGLSGFLDLDFDLG